MRTITAGMAAILVLFNTVPAFAAPQIGIQDNSPVDIVLTAGETRYNLESFKTSLENALRNMGVDLQRVQIEASETSTMDMSNYDAPTILSTWQKWGDKKANYIYDAATNSIVDSVYHCLRSGYYDKTAELLPNSSIAIEGDITAYQHSCNNYFGFTFRQNGSKDYYALVWQDVEGTKCGMMAGQPYVGMALIKVVGCTIDNGNCYEGTYDKRCQHATTLAIASGVYSWKVGTKYNLKVQCDNKGEIIVWLDGKQVITYTDSSPLPDGTYGFISVGHTGSSKNTILFQNIKVAKTIVKDLVEVVRSPNWRPNSHRFVVDVCDELREDFANPVTLTELLQRVRADNSYYIGWSNKTTVLQNMNHVISRNAGNGKSFNYTDSQHINQTAAYIRDIVNKRADKSGKVYLYKNKDYLYKEE